MQVIPGTLAHLDLITRHRRQMFHDMGHHNDAALDQMSARFRPWLARKMADHEYLAWFALAPNGDLAAGLGLWLMHWPPHLVAAGPHRGNILNVYTEPAYRRQGLARLLMQTALAWCAQHHVEAVILHASEQGRSLYESLGFTPTNEMRLIRK